MYFGNLMDWRPSIPPSLETGLVRDAWLLVLCVAGGCSAIVSPARFDDALPSHDTATVDVHLDGLALDFLDLGADMESDGGAPPDAPVPLCQRHSSALICEEFETDLAGWLVEEYSGSVTLTEATAHNGNKSMESKMAAALGRGRVSKTFPPRKSQRLFFRGYVLVPQGEKIIEVDFMHLAQGEPPYVGAIAKLMNNDQIRLHVVGGHQIGDGLVFPRDKWFCVQMEIEIGETGSATLEVDGVRKSTSPLNTLPAAGYGSAAVGVVSINEAQTAATLFLDDVVVSDAPIGC